YAEVELELGRGGGLPHRRQPKHGYTSQHDQAVEHVALLAQVANRIVRTQNVQGQRRCWHSLYEIAGNSCKTFRTARGSKHALVRPFPSTHYSNPSAKIVSPASSSAPMSLGPLRGWPSMSSVTSARVSPALIAGLPGARWPSAERGRGASKLSASVP